MARPVKCGVDYFPHDVNCLSKKTVYALDNLYGNDGYAFWWKLLELLGQQSDFSFRADNRSNMIVLSAKTRISEQKVIEILDLLSEIGAIDPELWQKKVIWCQNFVDRLSEVFRKRNTQLPSKPSFCDENPDYRSDNPSYGRIIAPVSTQSKVKESKVNKRKENKRKEITKEKFDFLSSLIELGVERKIAEDWLSVRKTKKAANTETALNAIAKQIQLSGLEPTECIRTATENSWQGFKAEWLTKKEGTKTYNPKNLF